MTIVMRWPRAAPSGARHAPVAVHHTLAGFAALAIAFSAQAVYPLWIASRPGANEPSFEQAAWAGIYLVVLLAIAYSFFILRARVIVPLGALSIGALALLSCTWSVIPALSLRRSLALAGTLALGVWMVNFFGTRQTLQIVRATLLALLAASIVVVVIDPQLARDPLLDAFRGVFFQKNNFARIAVFALLLEIIAFIWWRGKLLRHVAAGTMVIACLVLADSSTAAIIAIGFLPIYTVVVLRPRWWKPVALAASGGIVVAGILYLSGALGGLLGLLGKDPTLSNRTLLWEMIGTYVAERPLLGWGFGAFWSGDAASPQGAIQKAFGYGFVHAHNGFIDVLVQLGWIGLGVVIAVLLGYIVWAIFLMRSRSKRLAELTAAIGLIGLLIAYNVTESPLLLQNSFLTVALAIALTAISSDESGRGEDAPPP